MTDAPILTSRRPYLLRAMHEWISDNQQTPHIVVDATLEGVAVPRQYVQGGKIILNISVNATSGLNLGNEGVMFRARFGGSTYDVSVPIGSVLGIYARETGQGMIFSEADAPPPQSPTEPTPGPGPGTASGQGPGTGGAEPKRSRPALKVVK